MTAEEPQEALLASVGVLTDVQTDISCNDTTVVPLQENVQSETSSESEELFCRICHEGPQSGPLLSPCVCSGTLALVHQHCLEHWLTASNRSHCELCQHHYSVERLPKVFSEKPNIETRLLCILKALCVYLNEDPEDLVKTYMWLCASSMRQQRRTLLGDLLCFLFITPLSSLSGWLCVQGALDLYLSNPAEALGLMLLTVSLLLIYIFWSLVSVRYHLHLFRTWRTTNQRVQLKIPCNCDSGKNQPTIPRESEKSPNKETIVCLDSPITDQL